jgi:hypothetical protein
MRLSDDSGSKALIAAKSILHWLGQCCRTSKVDIVVGYVLYSLHVCVCVGASDTTTVFDDPFT